MKALTVCSLLLVALIAVTVCTISPAEGQPGNGAPLDVRKSLIESPLKVVLVNTAKEAPRDGGKMAIELPLKNVLVNTAQPPAEEAPLDVRKMVIENPLKGVVADTVNLPVDAAAIDQPPRDATEFAPKGRIELPLKRVVANESQAEPVAADTTDPGFDNPTVAPGDVHWHDSFEEAVQASSLSGKPVLLFQLLGQLDQRFT